jgi:hypothetical protein
LSTNSAGTNVPDGIRRRIVELSRTSRIDAAEVAMT